MILDFNFTSASSEGSDEPVHLQSDQSLRCSYTQNMVADEDSDQLLANTNYIIKMVTIKIVDNWIIIACERLSIIDRLFIECRVSDSVHV